MNVLSVLRTAIFLLVIMSASNSCNKSSEFGADLLQDDAFNVSSLKDFKLSAYTQLADSVRAFNILSALSDSIMLFGRLVDPYFGVSRSEVAFNMRLKRIVDQWDPEFTFDSMVFFIAVDPLNFFGDTLKPIDIKVHQLKEQFPITDTVFFSNKDIAYEPQVIGQLNNYSFTPKSFKEIIDTTSDPPDTTRQRILVQIRMDEFGMTLFNNPEVFESTANFNSIFKGLYLRTDSDGPLMGLSLTNPMTQIRLYYSKGENAQAPIEIEINPVSLRTVRFFHEPQSYPIYEFLNNPIKGDSLVFIQGMSGARTIVELNDLESLRGKSIKFAQLDFYIAEIPENENEFIKIPPHIIFATLNKEGRIADVDEVLALTSSSSSIQNLGGRVVEDIIDGRKVRKYSLIMTAHLLRILAGQETNKIVLSPLGTSKRANRVIIYGPGHSMFPMQLKIIATDFK
jgi:hypothetical protein